MPLLRAPFYTEASRVW